MAQKYDDREACGVLGALSARLYPPASADVRRDAAAELLRALSEMRVPALKVTLAPSGTSAEVTIAQGKGRFGDPMFWVDVTYTSDAKFHLHSDGKERDVSLSFNHAEQRFEGETAPDATEDQKRSSALAALAIAIVSFTGPPNG